MAITESDRNLPRSRPMSHRAIAEKSPQSGTADCAAKQSKGVAAFPGVAGKEVGMASMAMPVCGLTGFDQAQENIEDVAAFIRVASRMNRFVRAVFSLVQITKAFNQAVETQHSILQALATPNFQHLTAQQYSESVDKLEHLIRVNEFIISRSRSLDFKPWAKYLSVMESQAEKFAGIAESFRLAADAGFRGYVSELIVAANESESDSKDVDWRDFVASLHD